MDAAEQLRIHLGNIKLIAKLERENKKLMECVEYTAKIKTFSNKSEAGAIVADKGKVFKAVFMARVALKEIEGN